MSDPEPNEEGEAEAVTAVPAGYIPESSAALGETVVDGDIVIADAEGNPVEVQEQPGTEDDD